MTGTTNQVQTPINSSVRSILANAANTENGLALVPANPNASMTGIFPGSLFSVWESASLAAGSYTPVLLANYNSRAANGVGTSLPLATAIDFGSIQQLNNAFSGTIPTITSITATNLIQFSSSFSVTAAALTTLSLPALKYIGRDFSATMAAMTSISLPALIACNGDFSPQSTNLMTTFSAPNLVWVGGQFNVQGNALTSVTVTSLAYVVTTQFIIGLAAGGTTISLPALISTNTGLFVLGSGVTTLSINSGLKKLGGSITATGMALSQTSVDNLLVLMASLDGTNGTTAYSTPNTIALTGGTSSAPSATGTAAIAVLTGRGVVVTTN